MLKLDYLKEVDAFPGRVSIKKGGHLTLDHIEQILKENLDEYGIPYELTRDEVQSGSIFSRAYEDCLCINHPEHRNDYFGYCIRLSVTGNVAFVTINYYGQSELTGKKRTEEGRKSRGNILGYIIKTDQQAFDAEYQYYSIVESAIQEIFE